MSCSQNKAKMVTDIATGATEIPTNFIRPASDRPNLEQPLEPSSVSIPVVDLQGLDDVGGPNRARIIEEIGAACRDYGFFQIKNHGISEPVIDAMLEVSRNFFHLPESERLKNYSEDPTKPVRLSTSFNVRTEQVANWRDFLRLHCYPVEDYVEDWPTNPPEFRERVAEYCTRVREVALKLLGAISESLGLEKEYLTRDALGTHGQHMSVNYYPPCPQPDLTFGLPAHADPNAVTLLLQDDVSGLQVLKDGKWISVNPIPYTFIVNLGDQIQVISNDRYKSVLHRAVVSSTKERISVPTFYCPSPDAIIGPARPLVDEEHPAVYRNFTYAEYYHKFWDQGLASETCLDMFKANSP
ncbi:Protein DMR6-LIKE OXYGENASE 2 [Linum grandiflorum]